MELNSIKNAFTQVVENQRLCSSKAAEVIGKIGLEIEGAITEIESKQTLNLSDVKFILNELHGKLVELKSVEKLEESWKQLDAGMSGYDEALEITFITDISKAYRDNNDYDSKTINQIVAHHLYQQCLFDLGDMFADEANLVPDDDEDMTRGLYEKMHRMLESTRAGDLEEALGWSIGNQPYLRDKDCRLQLKIHAVQLMKILQRGEMNAALDYVRKYGDYLKEFPEETKNLMANVVLIDLPHKWTYAELLSTAGREKMEEELKQQFCNAAGLSVEGHLRVSVAAGFSYLPHLLKLADQMASRKQEWMSMKECPEPFDLKKEFMFHSSYICGHCRIEVTPRNRLKLLPCGHAMCNLSLQRMINFGSSKISCHICGQNTTADKCKEINLSYPPSAEVSG